MNTEIHNCDSPLKFTTVGSSWDCSLVPTTCSRECGQVTRMVQELFIGKPLGSFSFTVDSGCS